LILCSYGITAVRLGVARAVSTLASLGAIAAARWLVKLVSRGGLGREDEGILAPIWRLPPAARRSLRRMWIQTKFYEALKSQIETICDSAAEVLRECPEDYGALPLVVITARTADRQRLAADEALSRRSLRGRQVLADDSGHWVPLDAPHVVAEAIIETVRTARLTSLARHG
jgi:hypothetical protein